MIGPPIFDPLGLVGVLNRHGVRYVVIGGMAAGVQGVVWSTTDLDICYGRTRDDLRILAAALADLDARPVDLPVGVRVVLDARSLQRGDWWTLTTRLGNLDCLGEPSPGVDYDFLAPRSRLISGTHAYRVASVDDLITMKTTANRPKDVGHIQLLRAAQAELKRSKKRT